MPQPRVPSPGRSQEVPKINNEISDTAGNMKRGYSLTAVTPFRAHHHNDIFLLLLVFTPEPASVQRALALSNLARAFEFEALRLLFQVSDHLVATTLKVAVGT